MIWLYRLLLPLFLLAASPYYFLRMRRRGGYGTHFSQRFGRLPALPPRRPGVRRLWLQAVSVGEMLAIEPILRGLAAGGTEVILTTTTSTGRKLAGERYANLVAAIAYFPIDWLPFSRRAWRRVNPDLAIVTEGERWPEHMRQARNHGVPVLCINARISDRSYERLSLWPPAASFVLQGLTEVLASSAQDAERFKALGVPADRVQVTGNIKLDVSIPLLDGAERSALLLELGLPPDRLVLLGSSTWPGEEEAMLAALAAAHAHGVACSLLLVPRHAERRGEIERLLQASGRTFHLRSRGAAPGMVQVAVGDTTGELRRLTQLADVVFVGKSLPPHTEGQTPVEAATLGKAILMGPGMANFRDLAADLRERGAARSVANPAELALAASELLADPGERARLAEAAAAWRELHRGGVARTLAAIRSRLAA